MEYREEAFEVSREKRKTGIGFLIDSSGAFAYVRDSAALSSQVGRH
jgi:hypothetical protein